MSKWPTIELTNLPTTNSSGNEEVFGEDAEEEGNILTTTKKSRKCKKHMTDDELFHYFDELHEAKAIVLCRNVNRSCLEILKEDEV